MISVLGMCMSWRENLSVTFHFSSLERSLAQHLHPSHMGKRAGVGECDF